MAANYSLYLPIIDRPIIRWPGGARLAFWICPNVEHYEYLPPPSASRDPWPRTPHPDVMSYAYRDYGNRVGFWRMLEVLDDYKMPVTVSLNVAVLELFPRIRRAIVDRNWAIMTHGFYNTRYFYGLSESAELAEYQRCIAIVEKYSGKRPKGALGPAISNSARTPDLLAEAGFEYTADWFWDDQPAPIRVKTGRLISVPYTIELNDSLMFQARYAQGYEGDYFAQICKDQFDVLYREGENNGRVMCVALHPFLIGQPHRIRYLEDILKYVSRHDDVWFATAESIADHYLSNYYDLALKHAQRYLR